MDQLTVTWTPLTTGDVTISYNVSINDTSNTWALITSDGARKITFTNLISDTLYTISVVAINCAGTSNVIPVSRKTCKWSVGLDLHWPGLSYIDVNADGILYPYPYRIDAVCDECTLRCNLLTYKPYLLFQRAKSSKT